MSTTVILNPYANRWNAGQKQADLENALKNAGIEYELKLSEWAGHSIGLAYEAAKSGNLPIVAVGGDGTCSEVVNGVMQAIGLNGKPAGPIGFIPFGTGNDLPDMLGIPRDLDKAVHTIAEGHTTVIDLGKVNDRYFDNNSAIGLEPVVTLESIGITWLKGNIRYMVSALIGILKNPTWEGEIEWEGGSYKGSLALVSVGNSQRTGGTFHMTPNASMQDGYLDFIFAPSMTRRRLLQLLPLTQTGDHIQEDEINEHRTTKITIRTKTPTPIQADGEVFEKAAMEITYQIIPQALRVFVPRSDQ
ncbi:MAG: YegS/Rv2252/BmrU family lipid kinase [Anaerolineales bacterium]